MSSARDATNGSATLEHSEKGTMDSNRDLGPDVVTAVYEAMSIDAQWSIREVRGFSWWGQQLRQRIWAEEPRQSHGETVTRVHAETDLLIDVPDTPRTVEVLSGANGFTTLSATIFDSEERRISSHCHAYFHPDNRWLLNVFKSAVVLQVAVAAGQVDAMPELYGGRVAASTHPTSGERTNADNMLTAAGLYESHGRTPSSFARGDFSEVVTFTRDLVIVATYSEEGLTAELPFAGRIPATIDHEVTAEEARTMARAYASIGRERGDPSTQVHSVVWSTASDGSSGSTALLQIRAREGHPALGSGLLSLLRLPRRISEPDAAAVANRLSEATG